ncbi:MAG: protein kinase, partial [Lachnospiraceae bacterium]|nr:protein kinase [Lachnospiraceae bacterium]
MASELCMNCFSVKGQYEVCPYCGYVEGTPPAQPHCLTPGTILGNHFIVGTVIGFGGFGITYKCYDTTLGITVAAKEFYPMGLVNRSPGQSKVGLLSGDRRTQYREQLKRFLMEAQSVAQFGKAKDIVNIYDYFEENGTAYIIMEYIDGILLKDYLEKQGAMPPDVAMSVIMPIIEAVKKIHSKGIIHRDISPDNIFITDENSIKIFDFGAAQLNNSKEGMAGEKVIKVGYSAPEQYRDKNRQGFYTDIYSVGAILYQMLTGRKPIESTEREYKDKMRSPMELGVKVNSNVDRAVMEAMAVRPEFRYQGIQQFEDALRNKRVAEYPKEKIRKRKRKRNWIIGTAATLVLAMGVTIALTKTVLKPKSEIFDSIISEETTITIWVENEDQLEQLESLRDKGFKQGGEGDKLAAEEQANPDKWEKFWKENEKVEVKIEVKPDMAEALSSTPESELPNMYLTDHVPSSQNT